MQSRIGSLNFMCRAIVPGRPFCRRLINATRDVIKPYYHIRITKAILLNLQTWLSFFYSFNGISGFHDKFWVSNADLLLKIESAASLEKVFRSLFSWQMGIWLLAFGIV